MDSPLLASLAAAGHLWRGSGGIAGSATLLATGYPPLDTLLGGGWPLGRLLEVLVRPPGAAELPLLLPALACLARAGGGTPPLPIVFIAPPHVPYAPACVQHGIDPARLLVVDAAAVAGRPGDAPAVLWAMEECLAASACVAVLAWAARVPALALRRLQLAALAGSALAVIVRSDTARRDRSPAVLRIAVRPAPDGLAVEVLRNRGGVPGRVTLTLD